MERMPTEMWKLIFENMEKSRDTENAYRTCKTWEDILKSTRSSWMFDLVFPSFLEYLSKTDILNCRSVCKKWSFGVDNFLDNNLYRRPATEDYLGQSGVYKTDFRDDTLCNFHKSLFSFDFRWSYFAGREDLFKGTKYDLRCKIVGKSIYICEPGLPAISSHFKFLEAVGHHVWFLSLRIEMPPWQALKMILEVLYLVPNIKTLQVTVRLLLGGEDTHELQHFMHEFYNQGDENRPKLPKIETLRLSLFPVYCDTWKEYLLRCIGPEHLQSFLHRDLSLDFPPVKFENLVDLSLVLNSERVFDKLLQLNCPIRRLSLQLWGHVDSSILFGLVKHFHLTLRNFELMLIPDYYLDYEFPVETLPKRVELFANRDILAEMKQMKRVTLRGLMPPSLNFLLGMRHSLEYLHLPLHNYCTAGNKAAVEKMMALLTFFEEIDVMKNTKWYDNGDKIPQTYHTNLWSLFPKLKLLSMYRCKRDVGNRRESYEKIRNRSSD